MKTIRKFFIWIKAKIERIPASCAEHGHFIVTVDGEKDNLYWEKENREARYYYSGTYKYCNRKGCNWGKYAGPVRPYKIKSIGKQMVMI